MSWMSRSGRGNKMSMIVDWGKKVNVILRSGGCIGKWGKKRRVHVRREGEEDEDWIIFGKSNASV